MDKAILKFDYPTEKPSIIKVIGVGGGGGNAVTHMYHEGIKDVNFALCNTDAQALDISDVPIKLYLGTLGAGGKPEIARSAAEDKVKEIETLLNDGTKMVFITAGMGGGTGTGAAPVIARIAKSMDILTVGIVTIPFLFERLPKIFQALEGVKQMEKNVDALLIINNERLREIYKDIGTTQKEAFKKADNTLTEAAKSIAEIITTAPLPGDINLDFADVSTILKNGNVAIINSGIATGSNRLSVAIESALVSPLLNNSNIHNAKKILFNIISSSNAPLLVDEMDEIDNFMSNFSSNIEVIWGTATDESLDQNIKVTVLATGFGKDNMEVRMPNGDILTPWPNNEESEKQEQKRQMIKDYYGIDIDTEWGKIHSKPHIFALEELDNDTFIELVINNPAYNRDSRILTQTL